MTSLRFGMPYRTAEEGAKYRLGYAVVDVRDVTRRNVETAVVLRSGVENLRDVEFILHDGKLWESAFVRAHYGTIDFFTEPRSEKDDARKAISMHTRVNRVLPFLTKTDYQWTSWDLPRDAVDMHDDFVATPTWQAIQATTDRAILVDGELFRTSPGPVYRCSSKGHAYDRRSWGPASEKFHHTLTECYGVDRADIADRIAMERHGRILPLADGWAPPEFSIPLERLPQWDSLSPAIEELAAQAMSSTNLFQRYYMTRTSTRALIDLRDALQSRFDRIIKTDTRGSYALPGAGRERWNCANASHLIDPLFAFLNSDPEFRKRVSLDAQMISLRLKHEGHLLAKVEFDDPDLQAAFKI